MKYLALTLVVLFLVSCGKTTIEPSNLKSNSSTLELRDTKEPLNGVWRTMKQWTNDHTILWCEWDENYYPTGCYYIKNETQDTLMRWVFDVNEYGQVTHTDRGNGYHSYYEYYPETRKLHTMIQGEDTSTYYWNDALDTVWKDVIHDSTWMEMDINDNILSSAISEYTQTYLIYDHPNPHVHYAPTSFFEGVTSNYSILDKMYDANGNVIFATVIDSVIDDRVYSFNGYNYEWKFFDFDTQ